MEIREFMDEIEVQNKIVIALTGDTVGKSIKGLFTMVKPGMGYPAFTQLLVKMTERGELVSRGTMLVLPAKPVDEEREALKKDLIDRTEALLVTPPLTDLPVAEKAPADIQQNASAGDLPGMILAHLESTGTPLTQAEIEHDVARDYSYTTVYLALSRMVEVGQLCRTKINGSRAYVYSVAPVIEPERIEDVEEEPVGAYFLANIDQFLGDPYHYDADMDTCTWSNWEELMEIRRDSMLPLGAVFRKSLDAIEFVLDSTFGVMQESGLDWNYDMAFQIDVLKACYKAIMDGRKSIMMREIPTKYLDWWNGRKPQCYQLPPWLLDRIEEIMPYVERINEIWEDAESLKMRAKWKIEECEKTTEKVGLAFVQSVKEFSESLKPAS